MNRDPELTLEKAGSSAMHENLSLDPQIHMKHQTGLAHTNLYTVLVRVRTEIGRPLGLLATSLAKRQPTPDLVRDCLHGLNMELYKKASNIFLWLLHAQTHSQMHLHTYIHKHMGIEPEQIISCTLETSSVH